MTPRPQTSQEDLEQRDKINRLDITMTQVIQPALKTIQVDIKSLLQKDYLTKAEAKEAFASKEEVKDITDKLKYYAKWGFLIAGALVTGLITLGYAIVTKKVVG